MALEPHRPPVLRTMRGIIKSSSIIVVILRVIFTHALISPRKKIV